MSQRSRRSQAQRFNVSSQSQSSRRSSQGNVSQSESLNENYDEFSVATVKFILNHLATKLPIKRVDIVKDCCQGSAKIFINILPTVQNHLKSVYGIVFHEVNASKASNKQYICFADNKSVTLLKSKRSDRKNQSLLLLILSYIFVKGLSISEGVLINFLGRLDISVDTENNYFGDVKKCLENFRKQLYIKRERKVIESSNEERVTVEWGERALMEFDKKSMLIEVAQIFHKPTLYFKKQHLELMQETDSMEVE